MFTEVGGDVVAFGVEIGAYRHLPRPIVLTDALHAPDLSAKMNADTLPNRPILSFTMKLMKDENTVRTNSQRYLYKARTERYLSLIIQAQASRLVPYITKRDTRQYSAGGQGALSQGRSAAYAPAQRRSAPTTDSQ